MRRQRYLGKGQIAVCMRSGIKCHASELVRDGRIPSLLVLPEWADPPHPQDRPYVPDGDEGKAGFQISPDNPQPNVEPVLTAIPEDDSGDTVVHLEWSSAEFAAGPRIEQYDVYRDAGDGFVLLDTVELEYSVLGAIEGPALELIDTDVTFDEVYRYKVVGVTSNGKSLASNIATTAAVIPTAVTLAGSFNNPDIDLSWTASTSGSYPITGYIIYRSVDGGDFSVLTEVDTTTYTDIDVDRFTHRYDYYVVATNQFSGVSPDSNTVSFVKVAAYIFAARGTASSTAFMATTNGIDWSIRNTPSVGGMQGICFSPELNLLVGVGANGNVLTSSDGTTWTLGSAAAADTWLDVTWAPTLGLFVAVRASSAQSIMTSPDGVNWTLRNTPNLQWTCLRWCPELSLFAAGAQNSSGFGDDQSIMTSPDGVNWTLRHSPTFNPNFGFQFYRMAVGPGYFVGSSRNDFAVCKSTDGITWTRIATNLGGFAFSNVGVGPSGIVVGVRIGGPFGRSLDAGVTWADTSVPPLGAESILYSSIHGLWVCNGGAASTGHRAGYSTDGDSWSLGNTPSPEDTSPGIDWNAMCTALLPV